MSKEFLIESITTVSNKKCKVCLDNKTDFVLYKSELYKLGLTEGSCLSEADYQSILDEILIPRAKRRAMHLLEKQDRSFDNLRSKLSLNGYPAEAVDAAIDYVDSFGYVDDERMARSFIRVSQDNKSKMRIRMDLRNKGIKDDIIELALEEEYSASEKEQICCLLKKRGYDSQTATTADKQKMYRFLASRGYSSSDISSCL